MPAMRGGVLSPEDARRLMGVLEEMTEYVDGEELEGLSAQKMIHEPPGGSSMGSSNMAPPVEAVDLPEEDPDFDLPPERSEAEVDALVFGRKKAKPQGM